MITERAYVKGVVQGEARVVPERTGRNGKTYPSCFEFDVLQNGVGRAKITRVQTAERGKLPKAGSEVLLPCDVLIFNGTNGREPFAVFVAV